MLVLVFHLGEECYALKASDIVRVLPLVRLRPMSVSAPSMAGLMVYQGQAVPVLDVPRWLMGAPCAQNASTRIVLIQGGDERLTLGLMVEKAYDTRRVPAEAFLPMGAEVGRRRFVSAVATDGAGFLHLMDPAVILAECWQAPVETPQVRGAACL